MEEKQSIGELLSKIHIKVYDDENCEFRMFADVIEDLAQSWETLNDDYKNKLYEAMGIMPTSTKSKLSYPVGIRESFKYPSDATKKETGIEYLENQNYL